ncbi:kinase-like domain-containing protein [Chaetomium tenue]|uniref:Kinase-like domain-containing protein n=1 Tax=Chaetomium tenue TaxID=1854479 RepID=A0ACB7NXJ9_9PEZI|nr:kinase-like domain-containing protein [Chaetomium globosum]
MDLDNCVVKGRRVPRPDIVLTLQVSAFEGCGPFLKANRSRTHEDSSTAVLSRHERAKTEEVPSFTIVLSFSNPPGQSRSHFVIGRDPKCCDVVCSSPSVSNQHIKVAIEGDHVVLYDLSSRGSSLGLGQRGMQQTWPKPGAPYKCILPHRCIINLERKNSMAFMLRVPSLDSTQVDEFRKRRDAFFAKCSDLGALSIASQVPTESATPSHPTVERRKYMYWFAKELGQGSFGTVYMVHRLQDWHVFAAKQIVESNPRFHSMSNLQSVLESNKKKGSDTNKRNLRKEMEALQSLRHERIVGYMDWYQDIPGRWILVMEYCQHGNLEQMIRDPKKHFKKSEIAEILKQTAEGLRYIHGQGITHRDLKPDNILLRSKSPLSLALADFGLADRKSDSRSRMETICGTTPYMAPEIWGVGYTNAVDIWALGVVGFALIKNGLPPLPGNRGPNYSDFVFDEIQGMFNRDPRDRLVANVRKMLARDPDDRLPAAECIEDASDFLDSLRPNQDQDGQFSNSSSPHTSSQVFRSSEIREIEEREFQTSRFRAVAAAAAVPAHNPSHKRGTDALPRSNSLEAPLPKASRTQAQNHREQKGSIAPQRPSIVTTTGQNPLEKRGTGVPQQPKPMSVARSEQPAISAQKRVASHQLRSESPRPAPQNPSLKERTVRRMLPRVEEEEEQRPGRKGRASASTQRSNNAAPQRRTGAAMGGKVTGVSANATRQ